MGTVGPLPVAAHAPQQTQQQDETRNENHDRRGVVETVQEFTEGGRSDHLKLPGFSCRAGLRREEDAGSR
jgi:hypothetical protein